VRSLAIDQIGVLVVGCGRAAGIRVRAEGRIPGVAVRAFCDPVPERAQQRAREYGLAGPGTWYADPAEALGRDDIQVVDVCAPVRFHCEIALKAIAAGKHVLMEKPMAQSLAEADAMIEAARERGVVLGQIFQNRFHRTPRRIKALVESGQLGPIVRARVYGTTIHGYDTLLWLLGDPVRVYAEWPGGVPTFDWELDANLAEYEARLHAALRWSALARFADGTVAVMQSGTSRLSVPQVFPFQTDDVVIDLVGERLAVIFTIWGQGVQFRRLPSGSGAGDDGHFMSVQQWFDTLYPDLSDRDGHVACRSDFFTALREGRRPTLTGEEGRRTVELLSGVYKSARDGVVVEFPITKQDLVYRERIWPNP
jgi:predicted dehydrogenase